MMGNQPDVRHQTGEGKKNKRSEHRGCRVLLADDDYEMRKLLAWSLIRQGYQVTECEDGNAMMKRLGFLCPSESIQPFDLVISDIRMPGSSGLQALKNAQGLEGFPPMILITAFPDDETRAKARQLGAVVLLEKPFDVDALLAVARRVLPPGRDGEVALPNPVQKTDPHLSFPVGITFRHSPVKEPVSAFIRDMAYRLRPFASQIKQVYVVVEDLSPEAYRRHRHHIGIRVVTRSRKPIAVSHDTDQDDNHENLYLGIRIAFEQARRQLLHLSGKRRAKRWKQHETGQEEIVDEWE
jgi:CheY-like chemotaxis protein